MRGYSTLFLVLAIVSACGSKPPKADPNPSALSNIIEIEAVIAYAPRRALEIEEIILASAPVQDCLRNTPEIRDPLFTAGIEGRIDYRGVIQDVSVAGGGELSNCLIRQLGLLALGRGRAGPFKMLVTRQKGSGKRNKPLVLDLSALTPSR